MARRREFDADSALDAALKLFWEHGYEGTSYSDLVGATGVSPSGLYAAFGNKEDLFRKAFQRYDARYLERFQAALEQPCAHAVIDTLLTCLVEMTANGETPPGCFAINAALACSKEAEPVRQMLADRRLLREQLLCERLRRAADQGDFTEGVDPGTIACLVMTVAQGVAVQAKSSVDRQQLNRIIRQFVDNLPLRVRAAA